MKSISFTDLKKKTTKEIKEGGCLNVTADGETIGILVVGAQEGMLDKIQGLSSQIDLGRGK